jgi:hypothetical protein
MPSLNFRDFLESLFPKGDAWNIKPLGNLDNFVDALGGTIEDVRDYLTNVADVRDPDKTNILSDLEKEFGVIADSGLTEVERRETLRSIAFAKPGFGLDDLQDKLDRAGFNLTIYANDPAINPNFYIGEEYSCVCGYQDSVCGNEESFCGLTGVAGYLLVNGPTYESGSEHSYSLPTAAGKWHLVFFVGGALGSPSGGGYIIIVDGDMEASDTTAWTAGNSATLTKETGDPAEGTRSLRVARSSETEELDVNAAYDNQFANVVEASALHISPYDNTGSALNNYVAGSKRSLAFYQGNLIQGSLPATVENPTNETDTVGMVCNGVDQGLEKPTNLFLQDEFLAAVWVKINDAKRQDTFLFRPVAENTGYNNLPVTMRIHETEHNPVFRFEGGSADTDTWVDNYASESFAVAGTGTLPSTGDVRTPGFLDECVQFEGGQYYQASSVDFGRVSAQDIIVEGIFEVTGSTEIVLSKYTSANDRLCVEVVSDGRIRVYTGSGSGVNTVTSTTYFNQGDHVHIFFKSDRNGQAALFVNGNFEDSITMSVSASGDCGSTAQWTIGARSDGASNYNGKISYLAFWTFTPADVMSNERYDGLSSKRAQLAMGVTPETSTWIETGSWTDGDMEETGTAEYTAVNAVISKESDGGSGQVLRVAHNGSSSDGYARKDNVVDFKQKMRITGRVRNSATGGVRGRINNGGTLVWSSEVDTTDWQDFDVEFDPVINTTIRLRVTGLNATDYAEFDDIRIFVDGSIMTGQERNGTAFVEKRIISDAQAILVPVGANWLRVCRTQDTNDDLFTGYLTEVSATNDLTYSNDLTNAAWTQNDVTLVSGNVETRAGVEFDGIVPNTNDVFHSLEQTVATSTTVNVLHCFAFAGDVDFLQLQVSSETNVFGFFDLDGGTVGTVGANTSQSWIRSLGNGVYHCAIMYTSTGATATCRVGPAIADNDATYAGDASTIGVHIWNMQHETDVTQPHWPIITQASSATRNGDFLEAHGYNHALPGYQNVRLSAVNFYRTSSNPAVATLADFNTDASVNRARWEYSGSTDYGLNVYDGSGATLTPSDTTGVNGFDGGHHVYDCCWQQDRAEIYIDRELLGSDYSGDVGTDQYIAITIGARLNGAYQYDGLVEYLEISQYGIGNPRGIIGSTDTPNPGPFCAYDSKDPDGADVALLAGVNLTGQVNLAYDLPTSIEGTWFHLGFGYDATFQFLTYNGAAGTFDSKSATVTGVDRIQLGYCGGYGYDKTDSTLTDTVKWGAVSLARYRGLNLGISTGPAWAADEYARGLPAAEPHLQHCYTGVKNPGEAGGPFDTQLSYDAMGGFEIDSDTLNNTSLEAKRNEAGLPVSERRVSNGQALYFNRSSHPWLGEQDHSVSFWIRIDNNTEQTILTNGGTIGSTAQSVRWDSTNSRLTYRCVAGATNHTTSVNVPFSELVHVAFTRTFNGTSTVLQSFLNGALVQTTFNTGAPVVSANDLYVCGDSTGGYLFTGVLVGLKLYNAGLTTTEVLAEYTRGQTAIERGPYATQEIEAETLELDLSAFMAGDSENDGFPVFMIQETEFDRWKAVFWQSLDVDSNDSWESFVETLEGLHAFRLYAKSFTETDYYADFDLIEAGDPLNPGDSRIEVATVEREKRKILEQIILQSKPLHSWAVMVVRYV